MKTKYTNNSQDGMALVITLILVLTLTILASSVFMTVNRYTETVDNISYRPRAMEAANSCIDQAIDWLATSDGESWMNGDTPIDLAAASKVLNKKTVLDDTTREGVTRDSIFSSVLEKSTCTKVLITKVSSETSSGTSSRAGVGGEIGSETSYSSTTASKSIYRIEVRGVFNVPLNSAGTAIKLDNWNTTSNIVDIEVHVGIES
jgi:Tfp pilus assembly protein PilX